MIYGLLQSPRALKPDQHPDQIQGDLGRAVVASGSQFVVVRCMLVASSRSQNGLWGGGVPGEGFRISGLRL